MTDPLGLVNNATAISRPTAGRNDAAQKATESFKQALMKNLDQVNRLQQDADSAIEDLAAGRRDDVAAVTIATQKADMAFQMLMQVRNKLVDAYEEIKQIRV
ncbi:MAG: flagellar hook-basal body complex protein FliE [Phycisphaera sp.]|nr:flagellar hook-basal body complex protein FliE [Phycisphaera sp.]